MVHEARQVEGGEEVVKVLGFGSPRSPDSLRGDGFASSPASVTLSYMSPERLEGIAAADFREDLWALGVVVFECLTGRRPFTAQTPEALLREMASSPPLASEVRPGLPSAIDVWISRALARRHSDRFSSVAEFRDALTAACVPDARASASHTSQSERVEPGQPRDLVPGNIVAGYRVERALGSGGMGTV